MPSERKPLLPKFSLKGLFWFASAVAIGFAVSQQTAAEEPKQWVVIVQQVFYSSTLLAIAVVLVVYELVRQAILIRRMTHAGDSGQFEFRIAWVVRLLLAACAAGLLVVTQLINRQILVLSEPGQFVQFYGELWPGTLLTLLLLLAMRLMLTRNSEPEQSSIKRTISILIMTIGVVTIGIYIVTDRLLVSWLVHVAIDGVEKSHAIRWHRPDVFPHHAAEGFQSFWSAFTALIVVLVAGASLVLTAMVRWRGVAAVLWIIFGASLAFGSRYSWWFVTQEFPRISPDLASQGFPTRWPNYVAGGVLLAGVAAAIGYQLAILRRRDNTLPERLAIEFPRPSGLMSIAAGLIVLGCGSDSLAVAYEAIVTPSWWAGSDSAWVNRIATFFQYFIMSESIIVLATALSGISIVWQYYRPQVSPEPTARVEGVHFAVYALATVAMVACAVPVFAAFGFCYWLGPWIL